MILWQLCQGSLLTYWIAATPRCTFDWVLCGLMLSNWSSNGASSSGNVRTLGSLSVCHNELFSENRGCIIPFQFYAHQQLGSVRYSCQYHTARFPIRHKQFYTSRVMSISRQPSLATEEVCLYLDSHMCSQSVHWLTVLELGRTCWFILTHFLV